MRPSLLRRVYPTCDAWIGLMFVALCGVLAAAMPFVPERGLYDERDAHHPHVPGNLLVGLPLFVGMGTIAGWGLIWHYRLAVTGVVSRAQVIEKGRETVSDPEVGALTRPYVELVIQAPGMPPYRLRDEDALLWQTSQPERSYAVLHPPGRPAEFRFPAEMLFWPEGMLVSDPGIMRAGYEPFVSRWRQGRFP